MSGPARFLLPCIDGIEAECAADAEALGARVAARIYGRVLVEADPGFLYRANLAHPTASRVLQVLAQGPVATLEDVRALAQTVDWPSIFGVESSFGAECVRMGTHPFTSLQAEKVTGDAVCARFRAASGERPPVDLETPEVRVVVHVRDETAYVCVDTSGRPLLQRPWRVYQPPAPLPATLASALVRRSGWTEGLLLDPVCGSGTIPIEADFRARRRAVNLARPDWAFRRLKIFDEAAFEAARDALACSARDEGPPILGNEQWEANVEGARANAQQGGARVTLRRGDFNDLPRPEGLRALVANPPWGQRIASRKSSDRVGAQLRARMQAWAEGGSYTAVVVIGHGRFQKEPPLPDEASDVIVGGITCRVLVYRFR